MPLFDFKCGNCQEVFESFTHATDETEECPHCGSTATKVFASEYNLKVPNSATPTMPPPATRKLGDSKKTMYRRKRWY